MLSRFKPPTPTLINNGGSGGGGTSISNSSSSVTVFNDPVTGQGSVQFITNGTAAVDIDNSQYVIIGNKQGIIPSNRLTIVDPLGQCLQLINSPNQSLVNFLANDLGGLTITTSGSTINIDSNKVYFGLNSIYIGNTLLTSTATHLNYTAIAPGSAAPEKALVTDVNRNINNINSLTAASLTGILQTAAQPNISSLNTVNIQSLSLSGNPILATAIELNYLRGVIPGTAVQNRALVLDSSSNITGINSLKSTSITGTLQTAAQPNITSVGKLNGLSVNGSVSIGNPNPSRTLDILAANPIIRMGNGSFNIELSIDMNGSYRINPDKDIIIASHKNMLFSGTSSITGLNSITASTIFGVMQTAAQPNITSIGALTGLNVIGDMIVGSNNTPSASRRLIINEPNGQCVTLARTATIRCDVNLNNQGDLELNLFRDLKILNGSGIRMSGPIVGITDLSASSITGTLQTSNQPNITSVGTLNELNVANGVTADSISADTLSGTITTEAQPNITSVGSLTALNVINGITADSVVASKLTGTLQTAAQPKITSVGTLNILNVANGITASSVSANTLTGTLTTSAQPSITSVGTLSSLTVANAITAGSISGETLTGTLLTPAQPNITSVGRLTSLSVLNGITASSVAANSLSGVLLTPAQPNITSVGTLSSLSVSDFITAKSLTSETLTGTILTSAQPNITSIGTLNKLLTSGPIGIGVANPTSIIDINTSGYTGDTAIKITDGTNSGSISIGSNGITINTSGSHLTLASGIGLRFVNGSITGLTNLTASFITGTLQTAAQPNITSVGTLDYLDTNYLGIGATRNQYRLNLSDTNGKFVMMSNGTSSLITSIIGGDYTINTSNDRLALGPDVSLVLNGGTIIGLDNLDLNTVNATITNPIQPNITALGTLSSLNVSGGITANNANLQTATVSGDLTVSGSLNLTTPLSFDNLSSSTAIFNAGINATSPTNGGTLTVIGGAAFSMGVYIGGELRLGSSTITEESLSPLSNLTPGIVNPLKLLSADSNKDLTGFNNLTALNLFGQIKTANQPNITTIGNLTNLNIIDFLGVGTTSPIKQVEINSATGECLRLTNNKLINPTPAHLDINVGSTGIASIISSGPKICMGPILHAIKAAVGNTTNTAMPLEIGSTPFTITVPYAFNTDRNAHGVSSTPATFEYSLRSTGRILCTGSVDVMSDKRTKTDVKELTDEYCSDFVNRTVPVSFNWKKGDPNRSYGYIAQDIIRAGFPDLVNLARDDSIEEVIDDDGFINPAGVKFTVSYQHVIPILAKNQKRLMKENEELKTKLSEILSILEKYM